MMDVSFSFTFQDSDGYIELDFNEEDTPYNGWSIYPHIYPAVVSILYNGNIMCIYTMFDRSIKVM